MKYLIYSDSTVGFKDDSINEILLTDVKISDEIYNKYFEESTKGKCFKILDINGETFEDIFQEVEFVLPPLPKTKVDILQERVDALETDKINLQNELEQAKSDNLVTMEALADVYEQLLAL